MPRYIHYSLLLLIIYTSALAQEEDKQAPKKVSVLPFPSLGYSPETDFYLGGVALFTLNLYDTNTTRTSNAKAEFTYSWRNQAIFEVGWNFFFAE